MVGLALVAVVPQVLRFHPALAVSAAAALLLGKTTVALAAVLVYSAVLVELALGMVALAELAVAVAAHRAEQAASARLFSTGLKGTNMKYAWIENYIIRDLTDTDPSTIFHPDVAALYTVVVPDNSEQGDTFADGVLTKKPIPEPVAPVIQARTISADEVRKALTLAERVKWDAGKLDEVVTVKIEFASPRTMADATELLTFLVDSGILSQVSVDKVLA